MSTNGEVVISILDSQGGQVSVAATSVQVVIGCSSSGTVNQIVSTRSLTTLQNVLGFGPLVEAAGMSVNAGGTILAIKVPSNSTGSVSSVTKSGTGSSILSITSTNADGYYDDYCVKVLITKAGTIGVAGITFQLSLDAGRTFGPNIALGTATSYAVPHTGFTLNFAAGTVVLNDSYVFSVTGPRFNSAGVIDALTALKNSPYAVTGFGSIHVAGPVSGADATLIQSTLDTLSLSFVYSRAILETRDGYVPVAWGGVGETEVAFMTAIENDFASVSAKRVCVCAGHYSMALIFANPIAGKAIVRRNLGFALAARQVQIPAQRHAGRVRDGSLTQIIIDSSVDPIDGFIHHDEAINPGFDAARLCSARSRVGLPGIYIVNPNLMAPPGSDFTLLPLGNVMDIACSIVHQIGQQEINSDVRLNANGTLFETDAKSIENSILSALRDNMISTSEISNASVAVDRTNNVNTTKTVNIAVAITARGYILQENVNIGFTA